MQEKISISFYTIHTHTYTYRHTPHICKWFSTFQNSTRGLQVFLEIIYLVDLEEEMYLSLS